MSGPHNITEANNGKAPKKILKVWGSGPLQLNGVEIECAVLEDGTPVLHKTRMLKALGRQKRGGSRTERPSFVGAKNLQPFIRPELDKLLEGIEYYDGKRLLVGYDAKILPYICRVYRDAERAGGSPEDYKPLLEALTIFIVARDHKILQHGIELGKEKALQDKSNDL